MSELKTDLASHSVLTLTGAAAAANCSVAELLSLGANGKIKIYVDLPSDLTVLDVDHNTLRLADDSLSEWKRRTLKTMLVGHAPLEMLDVKGLLLSQLDCKTIGLLGDGLHSQSIFAEAWKLDSLPSVISIKPSIKKKTCVGSSGKPSVFGRIFATYAKSQRRDGLTQGGTTKPEPIAVHMEKLRIFSTDLPRFLKADLVQKKAQPQALSGDVTANTKRKTTRARVEHEVIKEAMHRAKPSEDASSIWLALVKMAGSSTPHSGIISYDPKKGVQVHGGKGTMWLASGKLFTARIERLKRTIASV
jgi:hypothetical protein